MVGSDAAGRQTGTWRSHRGQLLVGVVVVLAMTGLSLIAVSVWGGGARDAAVSSDAPCTVPHLAGTVVTVDLADTGATPDGQHSRMTSGVRISLIVDRDTVPRGAVSFLAINRGNIAHELVVLPLADGQAAGARPIGSDATVSEAGVLAEASAPCGEGPGSSIPPGASSWVVATLPPGHYELICNLPGHYAAGAYTELTVT